MERYVTFVRPLLNEEVGRLLTECFGWLERFSAGLNAPSECFPLEG